MAKVLPLIAGKSAQKVGTILSLSYLPPFPNIRTAPLHVNIYIANVTAVEFPLQIFICLVASTRLSYQNWRENSDICQDLRGGSKRTYLHGAPPNMSPYPITHGGIFGGVPPLSLIM